MYNVQQTLNIKNYKIIKYEIKDFVNSIDSETDINDLNKQQIIFLLYDIYIKIKSYPKQDFNKKKYIQYRNEFLFICQQTHEIMHIQKLYNKKEQKNIDSVKFHR